MLAEKNKRFILSVSKIFLRWTTLSRAVVGGRPGGLVVKKNPAFSTVSHVVGFTCLFVCFLAAFKSSTFAG